MDEQTPEQRLTRYRAPRPASSPHITPAGAASLQAELKYLWKEKRPEVTRKVSEAAAQGDRSENADYIYGKKQLREIDGRIAYLSKRLDKLVIVDRQPPDISKVFFGAWVCLENDEGEEQQYRLVGADEFDAQTEYVSIDSPVARALLGKQEGDDVSVALGDNKVNYHLVSIRYSEP